MEDIDKKTILIGAYRSDKKHLDWILGKNPIRSTILYNVRINDDLFSCREGSVHKIICPDIVVLYNFLDFSATSHVFLCQSVSQKSEEEMLTMKYPSPQGSYFVYSLGREILNMEFDISRIIKTFSSKLPNYIVGSPLYVKGTEIKSFINENKQKIEKVQSPIFIDLFAGSGGLSLGFCLAGYENLFAVEYDKQICQTYRYNFPKHNLIECDITKLSDDYIKSLVNGKKIDVVIGGPPCQGFSMAGKIGRKFADDPRNLLFKEFVRVVNVVRPTCFVMENVARLYTRLKGQTRNEIISCFEKIGYVVEAKVICATDYNIPQKRYRVLFIGRQTNDKLYKIQFPQKSSKKPPTIKDAIDKYPQLQSGEVSDIPNHEAMIHSAQMLNKMSYVHDGGGRDEIPENIRPKKGDIRKYIRYDSSKPSICITGDMRKVFHYSQNRALTVRELAAIQTYPDSFIFLGSKIKQQQMVGNSVPPLLAEQIAQAVKLML